MFNFTWIKNPIKNLNVVNISYEVEKYIPIPNAIGAYRQTKRIGFRPKISPSCPKTAPPIITPMKYIVVDNGVWYFLSHTSDH